VPRHEFLAESFAGLKLGCLARWAEARNAYLGESVCDTAT